MAGRAVLPNPSPSAKRVRWRTRGKVRPLAVVLADQAKEWKAVIDATGIKLD
jgi:hypothetical protein